MIDEDENIEYYDGYFLNKDGLFTIDDIKDRVQVYIRKEIESSQIKIKKNP